MLFPNHNKNTKKECTEFCIPSSSESGARRLFLRTDSLVLELQKANLIGLSNVLRVRGMSGVFVPNGINNVGDYNSSRVGVVCVCVCPHFFFMFHDWITSKRFELSG